MLGQLQQVGQVELEVTGKLEQQLQQERIKRGKLAVQITHLMDAVQPLQKYWTSLVDIGTAQTLATAAVTLFYFFVLLHQQRIEGR